MMLIMFIVTSVGTRTCRNTQMGNLFQNRHFDLNFKSIYNGSTEDFSYIIQC